VSSLVAIASGRITAHLQVHDGLKEVFPLRLMELMDWVERYREMSLVVSFGWECLHLLYVSLLDLHGWGFDLYVSPPWVVFVCIVGGGRPEFIVFVLYLAQLWVRPL
jgi:hypothetical protein